MKKVFLTIALSLFSLSITASEFHFEFGLLNFSSLDFKGEPHKTALNNSSSGILFTQGGGIAKYPYLSANLRYSTKLGDIRIFEQYGSFNSGLKLNTIGVNYLTPSVFGIYLLLGKAYMTPYSFDALPLKKIENQYEVGIGKRFRLIYTEFQYYSLKAHGHSGNMYVFTIGIPLKLSK